jgi:hypothetical protein
MASSNGSAIVEKTSVLVRDYILELLAKDGVK